MVFFSAFKRVNKHLAKDSPVPVMEDHAVVMFRSCQSAGKNSTVRASFTRAGFTYLRGDGGGHLLGFDERKLRGPTNSAKSGILIIPWISERKDIHQLNRIPKFD
jgi:hypothetical protein